MSQESAITLACRRPLELYAYNAQGMLAREAVYADTALTSQSVYAYDNRGNRITKTDTAGESRIVTGYTYDANNRLTKRSVGEYNTSADTIYTYDANGNLYTSFGRSYTMDPYHRNSLLASVVSDSMGITQYTFNTVNQLVGVQKDGLAATYSYLPDGMRSEKTVNGVTTGHLWDGTNMVAETSGDAVVYKYVRGAGLLYAENAADEKTWYVKDAHGDTVQLTDGNGNIVWNYAYDAFGNQKETVNSGTEPYNPFRYTGEYFDAETGFIYLRARYMDPQTGRFISEDPVCDGANWYVYAGGNPVMLFDPSGLVVTAWDREHLTTYEQGLLSAYTNDWNNAYANGDEAGMNQASLAAESLRAKYRTDNEITLDNGITIARDEYAATYSTELTNFSLTFAYGGVTYDLGQGWSAVYGNEVSDMGAQINQKHIHILYKKRSVYAQNIDGSPHDKSGDPPNSVKKSLKKVVGWDWDKKRAEYENRNSEADNGVGHSSNTNATDENLDKYYYVDSDDPSMPPLYFIPIPASFPPIGFSLPVLVPAF